MASTAEEPQLIAPSEQQGLSEREAADRRRHGLGNVVPPERSPCRVSERGPERNHFLMPDSNTYVRYILPASLRHNPRVGVSGEFSRTFILQKRIRFST
jgi:hypothetical protein